MNLLFLIGKFPGYGGTEIVTSTLANELILNAKNKIFIAAFDKVDEPLFPLNNSIQYLWLSHSSFGKKNTKLLKEFIQKHQIQVILNQWCLPPIVTRICKNAIGNQSCKLIAILHNPPYINARVAKLQDELKYSKNSRIEKITTQLKLSLIEWVSQISMRYVYQKSDQFVLLSDSFKKSFAGFTRLKKLDKLSVIPNPLTVKNEKSKNYEKENWLLYVGRMDKVQKKVHRVIEVWEQLYPNYPNWQLHMVGDGEERETLMKYVMQQNIPNVIFHGFQNPESFYQQSKILLLTSDYEGFGLVITEGMSYGVVPVVYGSYEAVHDIVEHAKSGYITSKPFDIQETVCCITSLMDNETRRSGMALEAQRKARTFTLESVVDRWEQLFVNLFKDVV